MQSEETVAIDFDFTSHGGFLSLAFTVSHTVRGILDFLASKYITSRHRHLIGELFGNLFICSLQPRLNCAPFKPWSDAYRAEIVNSFSEDACCHLVFDGFGF